MAKKQVNVSNVKIEKIDIESSFGKYDLVPHLEELNIYEDIFSNYLHAHIILQDAFNIPYKLPIIGEETVDVSIRMEGDDGDTVINPPMLHVHELSDRFLKTNQSQRFSLDLISAQYMSNVHARVSKSYSGMTADDIVGDIWANYLDDGHGDIFAEPCKLEEQCIIPNWTPHEAFNWLASRAQSEDNDHAANFLYYETMEGCHFKSLNKLAGQPVDEDGNVKPILTFTKEHLADDPSKTESLAAGVIKVDKITYMGQFQKVKNINEGQYSSKLITHDIVRKRIRQHDYDGFTEWLWVNHLGPFPPLSNSDTEVKSGHIDRTSFAPPFDPELAIVDGRRLSDLTDSAVQLYPKHNKMYAQNFGHEHDNKVEEWIQRRAAQVVLYDGITMQVECAGLSFIRVGMTAILNVASAETTSKGKHDIAFDKFLTGTYMVTAIRHMFNLDKGDTSYKMIVELTKDGLDNVATSRLPREQGNE